jgi:hypothetical protein
VRRSRAVLKDERGTIMVQMCVVMTVLWLFAGLAVDIARAWVAREELKTAVEAASLAGALNGEKHVELTVRRAHQECSVDEDGRTHCRCVTDGIITVRGTEEELIDEKGWRRSSCDKLLGYENRWIEYPSDTKSLTETVLDLNWPGLMSAGGGGTRGSSTVDVYGSSSEYGPSVVVEADGAVKTTFLNIIGIEDIPLVRKWQSITFYDVIQNGWSLGRNTLPEDATERR